MNPSDPAPKRTRGRPKKIIEPELYVEPETLQDQPLTISHSQAKALLKTIRPPKPRSEAQLANAKRLGEMAKERWAKLNTEKAELARIKAEAEAKAEEERRARSAKLKVKPKRTYTKKPKPEVVAEEEEDDEEEEEDDSIQKAVKKSSHKASQLVQQVTEIDAKINQLKGTASGRYDSLLRF